MDSMGYKNIHLYQDLLEKAAVFSRSIFWPGEMVAVAQFNQMKLNVPLQQNYDDCGILALINAILTIFRLKDNKASDWFWL
jgi:hypothetical protein